MYDPLRAKAKVVFYSAIAFLFGLGMASGLGWTSTSQAMPAINESPQISPAAVKPATDLSEAFTNLADLVTPALVRIESLTRRPAVRRQDVPDAFRRFFDDFDRPPPGPSRSSGSGFIVSEDGYILTNNHVVEGADEVTVYLPDRRYFPAEIVGNDPFTDVAVIRIDVGEPLTAMSLGNSDDIRVGEWILALGNPGFGSSSANSIQLDFTVTAGIISARGRGLNLLRNDAVQRFGSDLAGYTIEDFIQTDAVINPGNSGGPMINLKGQVVGINSAIASTTGVYQGYGFAVPINLARRVMEDLVEYGHVKRPRLGVRITDVTPEDAEIYGLPSVSGIRVDDVPDDGPAVGILEQQDVIVAIEGRPVGYVAELQARIAGYRPGDRVTLSIYRDKSRRDVTVRLAEAPINEISTRTAEAEARSVDRLGINVVELDPELASKAGYEDAQGVVLSAVSPGSPAARFQVQNYLGWKLVRINDTEIESTEDVAAVLDDVDGGQIVQLFFRNPDGDEGFVNVRMPE